MKKRHGNNPKRRVTDDAHALNAQMLSTLCSRVRYVGSGHHKRYPADYGFERTNPVPTKSLCDAVAPVSLAQAQSYLIEGIRRGMISTPAQDGYPKYVWCVTDDGHYHGYPLELEDDMCAYIRALWDQRCQAA